VKFLEFLSAFISKSLSFLGPNQIIDAIVERFQRALKALIILVICTAMSCVTLAYLIDRFLTQLDAGEFVFSRSIILLLLLQLGFGLSLIMTLKNLAATEKKAKRRNELQQTESALESAVAALIMSYVNEREQKNKSSENSHTI
jgi:uncharacterized membrane protein YidH (DUF202 family)